MMASPTAIGRMRLRSLSTGSGQSNPVASSSSIGRMSAILTRSCPGGESAADKNPTCRCAPFNASAAGEPATRSVQRFAACRFWSWIFKRRFRQLESKNRLYAGVGAFDLMQPAFVQCAFVGDMVKNRNIRIHHQSGKCTYGIVIEESSLRLPYHDRQG